MATLLTNNHNTRRNLGEGIVERLFNDVFDSFWEPGKPTIDSGDIYDNGKEYLIEEAVPGMNKKDLKLTVDHEGRLVLKGEKDVSRNKRKSYYQFSSNIHRSYWLPDDADVDKIKANVKDGLMRISIGKTGTTGYSKNITISGGSSDAKQLGDASSENLWDKLKRWFK